MRVYVRYPERLRDDIANLAQLRIRTPQGEALPLSVAASITETRSYTQIERIDGRRIIETTADVDESVITPGDARTQAEAILQDLVAEYDGLAYRLSGAGREQSEDLASLGQGLMVALLVM